MKKPDVWRPGIRHVALELSMSEQFHKVPQELSDKWLRCAVSAQEIADMQIVKMLKHGSRGR